MPDTLHYSFAVADDLPEAVRVVAHSFPGRTPAWLEAQLRWPAWGGGPETLLLGRDGGRIVAACQLHPLRQWIAGRRLTCAGVGTVAVSPAYRRRSLGAELVTVALREALERGDLVSALYPFRVSFYQKLGYGQAGEALQFQVAPRNLPDSSERMRVELLESPEQRAEALALYESWIRGQNGQLERPPRLWSDLVGEQDRGLAGFRAESGELLGYALVVYRTDLPRRDRFLEVEELVWSTPEARRGLYAWLASLSDQWEQILIRGLPSHRVADWLREPRLPPGAEPQWRLWAPAATLLHGTMFRLLDLRAAWQQRAVLHRDPFAVAVDVHDPQLPENAGSWRLGFDGGHTSVERTGSAAITLRLDISTLSRLYAGGIRATDALLAGLLECDRPDLLATLDDILALPEPWTFDRF